MTRSTMMWGAMVLAAAVLVGCGGGNDGGSSLRRLGSAAVSGALGAKLTAAAALPANDTATNSSSAFEVLQDNGVPAVVVTGAPKVNFAVFSDGRLVTGVKLADVSFAIAKLVPGANRRDRPVGQLRQPDRGRDPQRGTRRRAGAGERKAGDDRSQAAARRTSSS